MGHGPPSWPGHGPAFPQDAQTGVTVPPAIWTLVKTGPNAYVRAMFKFFQEKVAQWQRGYRLTTTLCSMS